jgi:hypothetical protein
MLKPWETLGHSQRAERLKRVRQFCDDLRVPYTAVAPHTAPPVSLIHLTKAKREVVRSVDDIAIAGEKRIAQLKHELAISHGTATTAFTHEGMIAAYLADPLRFIGVVAGTSGFLAIGGDSGGDSTKLGITFTNCLGAEEFAALLVMDQKDNWDALFKLAHPGLTTFTGDSAAHATIWSVLQSLVLSQQVSHGRAVFLNGDWAFLNTVLGLSTSAATHPCPLCLITLSDIRAGQLAPTTPRTALHTESQKHLPLLLISSEYVVPLPLHIFLGLSNKLVRDVLSDRLGAERVAAAVKSVKATHAYGSAGLAAVHDLNGSELSTWLKRGIGAQLTSEAHWLDQAAVAQIDRWMHGLHSSLLHKGEWVEQAAFTTLVEEVQRAWIRITGLQPTPKVHMLSHALEFAARHHLLGRYSEARIESYHAAFNHSTRHTHRNQGSNLESKLRRSLADMALQAVQAPLRKS